MADQGDVLLVVIKFAFIGIVGLYVLLVVAHTLFGTPHPGALI